MPNYFISRYSSSFYFHFHFHLYAVGGVVATDNSDDCTWARTFMELDGDSISSLPITCCLEEVIGLDSLLFSHVCFALDCQDGHHVASYVIQFTNWQSRQGS